MASAAISMHLEIFITKAVVSFMKGSDFLLSGVCGCLARLLLSSLPLSLCT